MKLSLFTFCILIVCHVQGQIGGTSIYEFSNLASTPRTAALAGQVLAINDGDINLAFQNPAMISSEMHNHLALGYVDYFGDISLGNVTYAREINKVGTFVTGLRYIDYGQIVHTDMFGQKIGSYYMADYVLTVGYGRNIKKQFYVGANLNSFYSALASYTSFGMALDVAGMFVSKDSLRVATAIVKNMGYQIINYTEGNNESLPIEIKFGFSSRFKHAPFRLSTVYRHAFSNALFVDINDTLANIDIFTGEELLVDDKVLDKMLNGGDKFLRHITIGSELLFSDNLHIRFGYNYRARKEMTIEARTGLVGFSFGVGVKIKNISIRVDICHKLNANTRIWP